MQTLTICTTQSPTPLTFSDEKQQICLTTNISFQIFNLSNHETRAILVSNKHNLNGGSIFNRNMLKYNMRLVEFFNKQNLLSFFELRVRFLGYTVSSLRLAWHSLSVGHMWQPSEWHARTSRPTFPSGRKREGRRPTFNFRELLVTVLHTHTDTHTAMLLVALCTCESRATERKPRADNVKKRERLD